MRIWRAENFHMVKQASLAGLRRLVDHPALRAEFIARERKHRRRIYNNRVE
jgi:hypothetical protein